MAVCPQCKAPNPAPVLDGELFRRIAEVGAAEGERERRASHGRRIAGFVAFALSLLTVVPALLVMFLTAKRWGRVPFVLIVVDVVILTLATYGTRLFPLIAISAIASVLVFVLRYAQVVRCSWARSSPWA
jgi:heme/copper-type cytochrome/quinol oxidase subunit 4